ncbi:phage tail protein [Thauera butanivorans]|uniref:phage tail protein n=1 Tax=Thauera butanivorans TaxID=86174 RepID=UPI000A078A9B|nr:phage tail protein [Thauera butanivorans]
MLKPASLRAAIEAAFPDLQTNPDRLLVFVNQGSIRCTAAASLSFEYGYTLEVIVTNFAAHADAIMVPVLAWVAQHQHELLANPDRRDGITFEADLLDHSSMDLVIRLQLTERVVVSTAEDGTHTARHVPEPPLDLNPYADTWSLTIRHPDGTHEDVL